MLWLLLLTPHFSLDFIHGLITLVFREKVLFSWRWLSSLVLFLLRICDVSSQAENLVMSSPSKLLNGCKIINVIRSSLLGLIVTAWLLWEILRGLTFLTQRWRIHLFSFFFNLFLFHSLFLFNSDLFNFCSTSLPLLFLFLNFLLPQLLLLLDPLLSIFLDLLPLPFPFFFSFSLLLLFFPHNFLLLFSLNLFSCLASFLTFALLN